MELDTEIFAVGKWNGMTFTLDDLKQMAQSFAALAQNQDVMLKLGHNDAQKMTDGQPALGWVSKVWVAGDKLMARFTDLPKIVHDAITKKLYKNVSVELDLDVQYKSNHHPYVLTGVALLGADVPAVNTLKDLTHYLSRDAAFSVGRKAVFSAIAGQSTTGDRTMELAELTKQVAALTASVSTLTTENAAMKAEKLEMSAKVAKFEADAKAVEEATAKARVVAKRAEVVGILEEGVKTEAITPAQREQFSKLMRIDDDAALMAIDVKEVQALTANGKKKFSREQAKQGDDKNKVDLTAAQRVVLEIKELRAANKDLSFAAAQTLVFSRNKELAKEYVNSNDDKE